MRSLRRQDRLWPMAYGLWGILGSRRSSVAQSDPSNRLTVALSEGLRVLPRSACPPQRARRTRASWAAALLMLLTVAPGAAAQQAPGRAPLALRPELSKLDALLGAGDTAAADALLASLAPVLAKDDRLAFDTIYVLIGRGRDAEARSQWNGLAPRVQQRVKVAGESPTDADRRLLGEALFTQGLLAAHGGDKTEALQFLQQADGLGFPPLDSPLMRLAAETLVGLQEYDLAASAYRELLKHQPANRAARAGLGAALYGAGRMSDAQHELEAVVRDAPKTPRANYTLGAVLFQLKDYVRATAHLQAELALDPHCEPCFSQLAHIAWLEGDEARTQAWLEKAGALGPASVEATFVAGALALRQGKHHEAIRRLEDAVARAPDYATARFQLATAYRRAGQVDKAREQLEIYQRLMRAQKDRENGVRGSG